MPFIKISGLTTATAVSATNQFEINQNGGSRSATVAQVAAFARTSATDPVVLPAGTVSAPALTFTGDTNTGIYSPAADTIAFTEGGVEAMRIDSSGSVGIGTASPNPAFRLDVSGIGRFTTGVTINGGNALQLIESSGNNAWNFNNNLNNLTFTYNATERMRIDASGNVGIGTSSPASRLDVNGVIRDSKGDVRSIPQNAQTGAYTLVVGDAGRHISITTGGVTVPASVFSIGDAVTIFNNSGSNQTITQGGSVTLRQAGTANTGNRTLAQYGVCTILCVASNTFVISGAGLT